MTDSEETLWVAKDSSRYKDALPISFKQRSTKKMHGRMISKYLAIKSVFNLSPSNEWHHQLILYCMVSNSTLNKDQIVENINLLLKQ